MKKNGLTIAFLSLSLGAVGCARITSQVVEKPRMDQQLQGNRGFLVGAAPQAGERKATRQIVQTDIELPTAAELNPWRIEKKGQVQAAAPAAGLGGSSRPFGGAPAAPLEVARPSIEPPAPAKWEEPEIPIEPPIREEPKPEIRRYTVKSGDTLEKISAKVYGDSSQWRRIYEANQDSIKSPNRIYAGQKLVIPPAEAGRKRRADSGDLK